MSCRVQRIGKRRRDSTASLPVRWTSLFVLYSLRVSTFCPHQNVGRRFFGTSQSSTTAFQTRVQQQLFLSAKVEGIVPVEDSMEHVWIWQDEESWKQPDDSNVSAAQTTKSLVQNWCEKFVLELDLCPWAKASIQTPGAMRFFLVPPLSDASTEMLESMTADEIDRLDGKRRQRMEEIVQSVTKRFQDEILTYDGDDDETPSSILEKAAIYFVVFLPNDDMEGTTTMPLLPDSFFDFIDWFTELEETWPEDSDNVIVAPFHPSWEFGDVDDLEACLDYEKRSPYPLVTLVSTDVVEKAGATVTEAIGEHNRQVLLDIEKEMKSQIDASVGDLWLSAVYGKATEKKD